MNHKEDKDGNGQSSSNFLNAAMNLHKVGNVKDAEILYREILKKDSKNPDANHLLGMIALSTGDYTSAETYVKKAINSKSNESVFYNTLGCIYRKINRLDAALDALHDAIRINPQYAEAYNNLGNIYRNMNRVSEAIDCYQKAVILRENYPDAYENLGDAYEKLSKNSEAIKSYVKANEIAPDSLSVINKVGVLLLKSGQIEAAKIFFEKGVRISPDNRVLFYNLGNAYTELSLYAEAIASYQRAIALYPNYAKAYKNLGVVYKKIDQIDLAIESYSKAIAICPNSKETYFCMGNAYLAMGNFKRSVEYFKRALLIDPEYTECWRLISKITKYQEVNDDVLRMKSLYNNNTLSDSDKMHLGFGLGKVCEDLKQFDCAFNYILEANAIKRKSYDYLIQDDKNFFDIIKSSFTSNYFADKQDFGIQDETPLFILGMPRSGTSLVEQILVSHPKVYGGGELNICSQVIEKWSKKVDSKKFSDFIKNFNSSTAYEMGKAYLEGIRKFSELNYITDKMPHNFLYIGILRLILPKAKIIHCSRNPMDTCLSIFKQYFSVPGSHKYGYNLDELGMYYSCYNELMNHWREVVPDFGKSCYEMQYEELIFEPEDEIKRLLKFCGLEWDERCLSFYETKRNVATASAAQVKRPIYKDSAGLWRKYEKWLSIVHNHVYGGNDAQAVVSSGGGAELN